MAGRADFLHAKIDKRGSVTHYYHFMFAVLVPVALLFSREMGSRAHAARRIFLRSCGPMNSILEQLRISNLRVIKPRTDKALGGVLACFPFLPVTTAKLPRFDQPSLYDRSAFHTAANWLAAQVGTAPFGGSSGGSPHILLIDRGEPDPFYLSTRNVKRPGAGRTRRSIPNIRELHDQLLQSGYPTRLEQLEGKSLASQIDLFRWADIIIAQHGAALANIIWAKPTATIIEVLPEGLGIKPDRIHFRELAVVMGCPYISVSQDGAHAPVDSAAIVKQVAELTA